MNDVSLHPKYDKQVNGYSGWLKHKDPQKRAKAALMLGELGAATEDVIIQLIQLAENDKDPTVRKNAKYALGMFAALRDGLADPDRSEAVGAAYERVGVKMRLGKRAKYPAAFWGKLIGGLSGLLVLLIAANVGLWMLGGGAVPPLVADGGGNGQAGNSNNNPPIVSQAVSDLVDAARAHLGVMDGNSGVLEAKLAPVLEGNQPADNECPFPYNSIAPLEISADDSAAYPQIASVYSEINATLTQFDAANSATENACQGVQALTMEDATAYLVQVSAYRTNRIQWESQLTQAATPPTAAPTEPPTALPSTDAPTPTATDIPDLRVHVAALYSIIDEATSTRGPSTILTQYWQEAQNNSGVTDGCRAVPPAIPSDYVLPAVAGEFSPQLAQATTQVNAGLQTLRDGWTEFQNACANGNIAVLNGARDGLNVAVIAAAAFDNADVLLQQVRSGS